jgi:hypothetical protein
LAINIGRYHFYNKVSQWIHLYGWRSWPDHWRIRFWPIWFLLHFRGVTRTF